MKRENIIIATNTILFIKRLSISDKCRVGKTRTCSVLSDNDFTDRYTSPNCVATR